MTHLSVLESPHIGVADGTSGRTCGDVLVLLLAASTRALEQYAAHACAHACRLAQACLYVYAMTNMP